MLAWLRRQFAGHGVRSLGRRGGILLGGEIAAGALAVAIAVLLARSLGPSDYGRYAVITATVTIVYQVIDVRIWEASTRFGAEYLAWGERLRARAVMELSLPTNLAGGLVATGLLALFASLIAEHLVQDEALAEGVMIYACVAPFVAVQIASMAILRIFDRLVLLSVLTAAIPFVRLLGIALALALDGGIEEVLLASLVGEALGGIAFVTLALREVDSRLPRGAGFRHRLSGIRSQLPRMGRFLAASNATGSLRLLNQQLDVVLAGVLATPAVAGAVKVAHTFTVPVVMLGRPFYQLLYPDLVRDFAHRRFREGQALLRPATGAMLLVLGSGATAIAASAPFLVPFFVGDGFAQAPLTIVPLIAGGVVVSVLMWAHGAALALEMQKVSLSALATGTAVQIALLVILVPTLEAPGAGLAYLAFSLTWAALLVPPVTRRISRLAQAEREGAEGRQEDGERAVSTATRSRFTPR